MMYEVTAALGVAKVLSLVQKTSPFFSEAPVLAGKTLRRGVKLLLTDKEYQRHLPRINLLLKAQAIVVKEIKIEDNSTHIGEVSKELVLEEVPAKVEQAVDQVADKTEAVASESEQTPKLDSFIESVSRRGRKPKDVK